MLLGYYKRFVKPIQFYTKVFTMRKRRKVRPKIGERLYMYTGGYNASRTLITNKETLRSIQNVRLTIKWIDNDAYLGNVYDIKIFVDRRQLKEREIHEFVKYDGFKDLGEFCEYWLTDKKGKTKDRTGAIMELYHWTDLKF